MLLTSVLALAALHASQGDGSLLARYVPTPTGANGYEDYLRAGDLAGPDLWPAYETWLSYLHNGPGLVGKTEAAAPAPNVPPGVTTDMTDLEIRKEANSRLAGAFDAIVAGNRKPCHDPRTDYGIGSEYPEFVRFKMLARLGANKAYVEFSAGRSTEAVKTLLEGIKFSKRIFGATSATSQISTYVQTTFVNGFQDKPTFQDHLRQLSLSDAQLIDKTCQALLATRLPMAGVFEHDLDVNLNSIDKAIDKPNLFLWDQQLNAFGPVLTGLSDAERQQLKATVAKALRDRTAELTKRLNGPEAEWMNGAMDKDPTCSLDDKSVSNIALELSDSLQSRFLQEQTIRCFVLARIQLMLLRLHAKVIAYHWQNYNWPSRIEEFADAKTAIDPFTGEPFHYEFKEGNYKLTSTGIAGIGPIELAFRGLPTAKARAGNPGARPN